MELNWKTKIAEFCELNKVEAPEESIYTKFAFYEDFVVYVLDGVAEVASLKDVELRYNIV